MIAPELIVREAGVDVDEFEVFCPLVPVRLERQQATDRGRVDLDLALIGTAHVRQVDSGYQVVAFLPALPGYLLEFACQAIERQVGLALGTQGKHRRHRVGVAQEDHYRHHAVGLKQFGEVEAVVRQPAQ